MDQDEGHHAITRQAVHELFQSLPAGTKIRGMTEDRYFEALDAAQAHQDRFWGPTVHPAWLNPDAQRQHAMADPHHTALENLIFDRDYIIGQIISARSAPSTFAEMRHLGPAVHALADSYSGAHMWRADSVYAGDPKAPIQSINVFDPGGKATNAPLFSEGTHNHEFDKVPLDDAGRVITGPAQAAVAAIASLLKAYEGALATFRTEPDGGLSSLISGFFQPAADGVKLNTDYHDPAWTHERDRRLTLEQGQGYYGHKHPPFDGGGGGHGHSGFESGAGGASGHASKPIGYVSPEPTGVGGVAGGLSSPANANVSYPEGAVGGIDPSGHGQPHEQVHDQAAGPFAPAGDYQDLSGQVFQVDPSGHGQPHEQVHDQAAGPFAPAGDYQDLSGQVFQVDPSGHGQPHDLAMDQVHDQVHGQIHDQVQDQAADAMGASGYGDAGGHSGGAY
jgi:hypothetical protein